MLNVHDASEIWVVSTIVCKEERNLTCLGPLNSEYHWILLHLNVRNWSSSTTPLRRMEECMYSSSLDLGTSWR
jgi:hypothetical protein